MATSGRSRSVSTPLANVSDRVRLRTLALGRHSQPPTPPSITTLHVASSCTSLRDGNFSSPSDTSFILWTCTHWCHLRSPPFSIYRTSHTHMHSFSHSTTHQPIVLYTSLYLLLGPSCTRSTPFYRTHLRTPSLTHRLYTSVLVLRTIAAGP